MPDGQAHFRFGFRVEIPALVAGDRDALTAQGVDKVTQLLARNVECVFQRSAYDSIFSAVVIAVQILRKLLLEHLCLLSGRFPGKKDKAKRRKKTGPPPVWGNGLF
ncbi:hypothetical protein SDC9_100688 [bioreactor metagenome]|uniref:Uncharacterized protein n=1 Tax=bioreactor metagenome TaxID=1076179 RepID=A0A645AME8_9ZZZZ